MAIANYETVFQLDLSIGGHLQNSIGSVRVRGEDSNVAADSSELPAQLIYRAGRPAVDHRRVKRRRDVKYPHEEELRISDCEGNGECRIADFELRIYALILSQFDTRRT